jgi:hypothetical protein
MYSTDGGDTTVGGSSKGALEAKPVKAEVVPKGQEQKA